MGSMGNFIYKLYHRNIPVNLDAKLFSLVTAQRQVDININYLVTRFVEQYLFGRWIEWLPLIERNHNISSLILKCLASAHTPVSIYHLHTNIQRYIWICISYIQRETERHTSQTESRRLMINIRSWKNTYICQYIYRCVRKWLLCVHRFSRCKWVNWVRNCKGVKYGTSLIGMTPTLWRQSRDRGFVNCIVIEICCYFAIVRIQTNNLIYIWQASSQACCIDNCPVWTIW